MNTSSVYKTTRYLKRIINEVTIGLLPQISYLLIHIITMKVILVSLFCVAMAAAMPYDIIEDDIGHIYYAVPVNREKR